MPDSKPALAGVTAQFDGERPGLEPGVKLGDTSVQPKRLTMHRVLKPLQQTFQVGDSPFQGRKPGSVLVAEIARRALIGSGGTTHLPDPGDEAFALGRSHLYVRRLGWTGRGG